MKRAAGDSHSKRHLRYFSLALGLAAGFGADVRAALAKPASYACSVFDVSGHAETMAVSWDPSGEQPRIGIASLPGSRLPVPQTATLITDKSEVLKFRGTVGKSEYILKVADDEDSALDIEVYPFRNAREDSGFAGYCRPSQSPPVPFVPLDPRQDMPAKDDFIGFASFSRRLALRCTVLSPTGNIQRASFAINPDTEDGISGSVSMTIGDETMRGRHISVMLEHEGDHEIIMTMFDLSRGAEKFIGTLRMRGPIFWIYASPAKRSQRFKAFCTE